MLASWLAAVACGSPPDASRQEDASLDRLRSLPYVGSTPIRAGEGAGVVYRDERSAPGYNLYTFQMLARAELIDEAGNVKLIWRDPEGARWERAELLEGGDLIAIGVDPVEGVDMTVNIPDNASYLMRFAWDGTLRWKRGSRRITTWSAPRTAA